MYHGLLAKDTFFNRHYFVDMTVVKLDGLKDTPMLAMVLIGLALFGFQYLINNIQTLPADYFNGKNVGVVSGMGGTSAVIGTLIITWLVPVITKTSYVSFFVLAAALVPLAWITINYVTSRSAKVKS